jgi:hypothetical protein
MPSVGFEPTIPVFERAKTVHALDGATTVIGFVNYYETYCAGGNRDSSVGIATGYWLDDQGRREFESR